MLSTENFTMEHINELRKNSNSDPAILERTVFAFGLLESLVRVNMPFIFKGGTCLMLLLKTPRRLSTDIDIIVKPGTDISYYIQEAAKIFPFEEVEEQSRIGKNQIEKRHFKFVYDSPVNKKKFYILLDVLFEENHYNTLVTKNIANDILITEAPYLPVTIPSIDCIGDSFFCLFHLCRLILTYISFLKSSVYLHNVPGISPDSVSNRHPHKDIYCLYTLGYISSHHHKLLHIVHLLILS